MSFNIEVIAKLLSPLLTALLVAAANRYLVAKPKLVTYLIHATAIPIPNVQPLQNVHTHSIVVQNAGQLSAKNVRIGHNMLPAHSVFPQVHYQVLTTPGGGAEILGPVLAPREQLTISYLYFPPVLWNQIHAYTKSDEGLAKVIDAIPTPRANKYVVAVIWVLIFIGASTVLYWGILWLIGYLMGDA